MHIKPPDRKRDRVYVGVFKQQSAPGSLSIVSVNKLIRVRPRFGVGPQLVHQSGARGAASVGVQARHAGIATLRLGSGRGRGIEGSAREKWGLTLIKRLHLL